MLQIRAEQMLAFEQAALRRFEDEMVLHSKDFAPELCEVIGEDQLRVALRQAMARAGGYGFTYRGSIRLFIELIFLCGSAFDTDPQYPSAAKILRSSDDQMQRAERMYYEILDYQEKVSGPGNRNTNKALADLSVLARQPLAFSSNGFVADMIEEMTRVFPQKAAYIGEEGLRSLIGEGRAEAQRHHLSKGRGEALLVVLMFAFGHGCTDDPLYPWIERTLKDQRIKDSAARAKRLEKKAVTWLDHVLASLSEQAQT
jgi:hypothetical protein